jgi:mannose-6-phosphate isomerase-like protein (cupin superfamily)
MSLEAISTTQQAPSELHREAFTQNRVHSPAHSHDAYDETIYGLEGVLAFTLNSQKTDVGRGEMLFIPRGAVHRFDNPRGMDAKMLAIVSPASSAPTTSAKSPQYSKPRPAARLIPLPSPM